MNVGEYNTLDLVKENTNKKHAFFVFVLYYHLLNASESHNILFQPGAILATRFQQCMCKMLD